MRNPVLLILALLCFALPVRAGDPPRTETPAYPADVIEIASGEELRIVFFGHGSLAFEYRGKHIYVDPVSQYADYARLPKADVILVTHEHGDHLDPKAIGALSTRGTLLFGNGTAVEAMGKGKVLSYGEEVTIPLVEEDRKADVADWLRTNSFVALEAFPAYNTSSEKQNFHPKERLHNGYILTFGGTQVYVAGDTEPIPEMTDLGESSRTIDIAFLPVNLPYTMTEEQAARAVRAIQPRIFYPYHYGGTDHETDLSKLEKLLDGSGVEVRIRPME